MFFHPGDQHQGEENLPQVRQNIGEHTQGQGAQQGLPAAAGVDGEKPEGAEGIAEHQPQHHGRGHHRKGLPQLGGEAPEEERGGQIAQQISARGAEQYPRPGGKAGEDRQAHDAQQ